jgi:hypothetical protein
VRVYCETIKKIIAFKGTTNSVPLQKYKVRTEINKGNLKNIEIKALTKYFILCESTKQYKKYVLLALVSIIVIHLETQNAVFDLKTFFYTTELMLYYNI